MRLTLDLDKVTTNKIIQKAKLLKEMFPKSDVYYRTSSGGKGGHICAQHICINKDDEYIIRSMLGDDKKRICNDVKRSGFVVPTQILFDIKTKNGIAKRATQWVKA